MNKIQKDEENKMVAGVLAGLSKQFKIDLGLLRLIYATLTLLSFGIAGVVIYVIAALVIPKSSEM